MALADNFMGFDSDGDAVVDANGLSGSQVRAYIDDSHVVAADDLTLSASSSQDISSLVLAGAVAIAGGKITGVALSGAGVNAQNKIGTLVEASIGGDTLSTVTADSVSLSADDLSDISAIAGAAAITASFAGTNAGAASIGVSLAENEISTQVEASIVNADVESLTGDVTLSATEDASIEVISAAAAISVAGAGEIAIALSGAGADATNVILTKTNAFIDSSNVVSRGDVTLDAENTSSIVAIVAAASGSIAIGGDGRCRTVHRGVVGTKPDRLGPQRQPHTDRSAGLHCELER